jgi:hypothetical protein
MGGAEAGPYKKELKRINKAKQVRPASARPYCVLDVPMKSFE